MKNKKIRLLLYALLAVLLLAGLVWLRDYLDRQDQLAETQGRNGQKYAPFADRDHPMYLRYVQAHPDQEIIARKIHGQGYLCTVSLSHGRLDPAVDPAAELHGSPVRHTADPVVDIA